MPLLRESGEMDMAAGPGGALVLSRALCQFVLFRAPSGLSGSRLARAARLFAETLAPFERTGQLILRSPAGASIWLWDAAKIGAPARNVVPESVWRARSEDWRILACADGFEAQAWGSGALLASTWRRHRFTREQWSAFVISADVPGADAPPEPPEPQSLPLSDMSWRRAVIGSPLGWRDLERGALVAAVSAAAVAALFAGETARFMNFTQVKTAAAQVIEAEIESNAGLRRTREGAARIEAYARAAAAPPALPAVADAFEALEQFGVQASAVRVHEGALSVIVDAAVTDAPVADIVAAFEAKPHLCGAIPEIAGSAQFEVRANIVAGEGPCASPGTPS